jgi:hypothetical protein
VEYKGAAKNSSKSFEIIVRKREQIMIRFNIFALLMLSCMSGSALGQTDVQESRPTRPETRRTPPVVEQRRASETSGFFQKLPESSEAMEPARIAPLAPAEAVQVITTKTGENERERIVFALRNLPASNTAATLQSLFKTEGGAASQEAKDKVVIVPETVNNSLVVSGPPAAVKEIGRLLGELDRPAAMVRLDVRIAEAPEAEEKKPAVTNTPQSKTTDSDSDKIISEPSGKSDLLARGELTTLDGQTAMVMLGRKEPQVTGATQTRFGRTNNIDYMNVGTQLMLTPRVSPDGTIFIYLDIADSRSGPMEEGVVIATHEKGPELRAQNLDTLQVKTTLRLQDGQPRMITGISRSGKARQITVTAHVIR